MFCFLLFFLFLSLFKSAQIPVFVDPSVLTTGDGSIGKKFKSLTEAIAMMSTIPDLLVLLEPNALVIDLAGKIEIPSNQMLTLTTNIMVDPLAKPAMLGFASNLQFLVNSGSKFIINYMILTRFSGQNVDYIFSVMPMGVLMTNSAVYAGFQPDSNLKGIAYSADRGIIIMNGSLIKNFNYKEEMPNLEYFVKGQASSKVNISFFDVSYISLSKGSFINMDNSILFLVYSGFQYCNFPDSSSTSGNILTANFLSTLMTVSVNHTISKNKPLIYMPPALIQNTMLIIQMALFVNNTQMEFLDSTIAMPLIVSVTSIQGSIVVMGGVFFLYNKAVNALVSVTNTFGVLMLITTRFINNFASDSVYVYNLGFINITDIEFSQNNVMGGKINPMGGSCLNLRNIIATLITYITISESKSLNTTAGLKLYTDESINAYVALLTMFPAGIKISYYTFVNNYANYTILNEIGSAIYIDSHFGMMLNYGKFIGNMIDAPDSVKDRSGGACINSVNLKNQMLANNTQFLGNQAKYFSNCIQFAGTLMVIDGSIFANNVGIPSSTGTDTEGIGGAINVVSENVTIVNTIFKQNKAYFAGCIYINMNNQKNYLNFLGFNLTFLQNRASNTGGAILFDADIMSAEIKIVYSLFLGNSASDYGGAISTKFASLTTTIQFGYDVFMQNKAQFGGVMDLEHVIGTVIIAYSNLTQNLAENSYGVGSGGAIYVYGRSTSYVILMKSFIFSNVAQFRGGGLFCLSGNVTHVNMSYFSNQAFEGGSLYGTVYSLHFVYGASFYNETTKGYGGAVVVKEYSVLVLYWSNVTRCNSTLRGGGLMMIDETLLVIYDTVFIENTSNSGSALYSIEIMVRQIAIQYSKFINNKGADTVIGGMYTTLIMAACVIKDNNIKAISYTKKSNLTLAYCQFLNQKCSTTSKGCFISLSLNSIISIAYSVVKSVYSQSEGGFLYLESSNMTLVYTQLYEVSATKGACIEGTKYSYVFIAMTSFQYYSPDCMYFSDALNVTLMGVNITDSIYSKMKLVNSFLEGGSALSLVNCPYIKVYGCLVQNNADITSDGGAIYIYMEDHNPIMSDVTGSYFVNNAVSKRGGAIYIYNQNISLIKNTFMTNRAESGGAIYFDSYDEDYSINIMKYNTFALNTATLEGGCFKYVQTEPIFSDNIFAPNSNKAEYGPIVAAYPVRMKMKILEPDGVDANLAKMNNSYIERYDSVYNKDRCYELYDEESGQVFSKVVEFYLLDPYDQVITTIQDGTASVQLKNASSDCMGCAQYKYWDCISAGKSGCYQYANLSAGQSEKDLYTSSANYTNISYNLVGETSVPVKSGKFTFDSLTLYANPGTNWTLNFTNKLVGKFYSNFMNGDYYERNSNLNYEFYVNIYIRTCRRGEIYDKTINTCFSCPPGKFSFDPIDKDCHDCPNNAMCNGGDQIIVDSGYWRSSINSTYIHECKYSPEACLGGYESSCVNGHVGPLCSSCEIYGPIKFTKDVGNVCSICIEDGENAVKILFIGFALGLLLVWIIRSALNMNEHDQINFRSIYFKIFLNYVQVTTLANGLEIDWPRLVQYILNIQVNLGNVTRFISLDCLFAGNTDVPVIYAKVLMYAMLPFALVVIIFGYWAFILFTKHKIVKNELIASLIISLFFIHPSLINILTSSVSCTEIDPGKYYITSDLYYECNTNEHNTWSYALMYPSLGIWAGFFPILIFYYLRRNSGNLNDINTKKKLSFLYSGFKQNHYYWEFVIMLRKFLLILVTSFWDSSVNVRALIVLLILAVSIYMQISKKPYRSADLNELEFRSTLVSLLTIYLGLLYMVTSEIQYAALIFVLIIAINLYFLLFWIVRMIVSYADSRIINCFPRLKQYLIKLRTEFQQLDNNRKSLFDFDEQEEQLKKGLTSKLSKKVTSKIAAKPINNKDTAKDDSIASSSKFDLNNSSTTKNNENSKINNFVSNDTGNKGDDDQQKESLDKHQKNKKVDIMKFD